ncbi:MAG: hypothetical protein HON70_38740 [Lentisphaerae bacterium]|nr:hypothetical protein [Lentisphaerota bacterium]
MVGEEVRLIEVHRSRPLSAQDYGIRTAFRDVAIRDQHIDAVVNAG